MSAYRPYSAPSESPAAFLDPASGTPEASSRPDTNVDSYAAVDSFWATLRRRGRRRLFDQALEFTRRYRHVDLPLRDTPDPDELDFVLSGHQPTLFHPGVWFKNHTLHRIAQEKRAVGINLVVDNDIDTSHAIRVPRRTEQGRVALESVSLDHHAGSQPFEQTRITDESLFQSFPERVRMLLRGLVDDPCVTELWRFASGSVHRGQNRGELLARARHCLEAQLGWQTLEVPLSVVAQDWGFSRFAVEILAEPIAFEEVYNRWTQHYRDAHGIRSQSHPVPNLGRENEWVEAPFWVYGSESPERRGLWVRRRATRLEITDRRSKSKYLEISDRDLAAEELLAAQSNAWKLRPRALMTTLFARTVLCDLFVHGIGGGKYDQLADRIAEEYLGFKPVPYLVATATIRLPGVAQHPEADHEVKSLRRKLRDYRYHGEHALDLMDSECETLRQRKAELIKNWPAKGSRAAWHREMESTNAAIYQRLQVQVSETEAKVRMANIQARSEAILRDRERSFCLYPSAYLAESFDQIGWQA
ncbi:MAG: hypothetical protein AAGD07_19120 [Planctomycetota bacterium]